MSSPNWAGVAGLTAMISVVLTLWALMRSRHETEGIPQQLPVKTESAKTGVKTEPVREVRIYYPFDMSSATILVNGAEPTILQKNLSFALLQLKDGNYTFSLKNERTCETRTAVSSQNTSIYPCR